MVTKLQEDYGKLVEAVCCRRTTASWWRTTASWWRAADGLHQLAVFLIPPPCSPTPPPSPAAPRGCRFRSPECSRDDVAVSLHRHTVRPRNSDEFRIGESQGRPSAMTSDVGDSHLPESLSGPCG